MTDAAVLDFGRHLRGGADLFNEGRYWEAHEEWEILWLAARGESRDFIRALIQLAAAFHHLRRGTPRGGARLLEAALRRFASYPPDYCGIDRAELERRAAALRLQAEAQVAENAIAPFPADAFPEITIHVSATEPRFHE